MSDKKYTHVWLAGCTGSDGVLLRTGKPFVASEHPYLAIHEAVEAGKARPLEESESHVEAVEVKPAVEADFLPPAAKAKAVPESKKGRK